MKQFINYKPGRDETGAEIDRDDRRAALADYRWPESTKGR
jgi:hypothetical protein